MPEPRDTAPAFAKIAEQLEYLLPKMNSTEPAEVLSAATAITQALASVSLTWDDLASRAAAPPPPVANGVPQSAYPAPPPLPPNLPPPTPSTLDPSTVFQMSDEERKGFGYRRPPDGA